MLNGLSNVLRTSRSVASAALHTFVVDVAREGAIDFRPLHPALRVMLAAGFGLLFLFLALILLSDQVRPLLPREVLLLDSSDQRTIAVPTPYVPLTLLAFSIAWGFILAGGLYTRLLFRWLILAAYVFFYVLALLANLLTSVFAQSSVADLALFLAVLLLSGSVFLSYIVVPRLPVPRSLAWCWMLALSGGTGCATYLLVTRAERVLNEALAGNMLSGIITNLFLLVAGYLLISGLGWIDFALQTSRWLTAAVVEHASSAVLLVFLLGMLGGRAIGMMWSFQRGGINGNALLGAGLLVAGLAVIGLARRFLAPGGGVSLRFLMWFAVLLPTGQYLVFLVTQVAFVFVLVQVMRAEAQEWSNLLSDWSTRLTIWATDARPFVMLGIGLLLALLAHRRANGMLATFGLALAWAQILTALSQPGRPLAAYRFGYGEVELLMVGVLLVVTLFWLFRNQLSRERMLQLFAISVLLALLNQTDFLDNPFSPLFGFAGSAFLVFGIFWNVIDLAGHFVNHPSPELPRESRALLYVGYALLAVAVHHWFIASHHLLFQQSQSTLTYLAFQELGYPLAYTVVLEGGRSLLADTARSASVPLAEIEPSPALETA